MASVYHLAEGIASQPYNETTGAGTIVLTDGKITGLDTALITDETDVATKQYVDNIAQGLKIKDPVWLTSLSTDGTAGNITLGGQFEKLDNINPPVNSRVLLRFQTSAIQNGIWVVTQSPKAFLNMTTAGCANLDSVIEAKLGGLGGNSYTMSLVGDSLVDTGEMQGTSGARVFHYKIGTTTIGDFEAAVGSVATEMQVKTASLTPTTTLQAGDAISAVNFGSGSNTAWTRPTDFAAGYHAAGTYVFIETGNTMVDTSYVCNTDSPTDIVGTNSLSFVQFGAAGVITAGVGLDKSGNNIFVKAYHGITANANGTSVKLATNSGLSADADGLTLASGVAGGGLTLTTGVLAVGAGSGISVGADAVALGQLSAEWNSVGTGDGYNIKALSFESTKTTIQGAPFTVVSTVVVTNLNADKVDGRDASEFLLLTGGTMSGNITMGGNDLVGVDAITSNGTDGLLTLTPNGAGYTVTTKDIRIDSTTQGLVLRDSADEYWRLSITTSGVLVTTQLA